MDILVLIAIAAVALGAGALVLLLFLAIPAGAPTLGQLTPARGRPGREPRRTAGLQAVVPRGYLGWLERQIVYAGRAGSWTVSGILGVKVVVALVGVVIGALIIGGDPSPVRIFLGIVFIVLTLVAPEVIVSSRADDRQKLITLALPDTLDQMTIATEAGLGFDAAMQKAAYNGRGPLSEELVRTLQDMSIGRSRRDSYRALEQRTNSEDLRRFIRAIVQADSFGISIADVLRVQAGEMRLKRRQRAEERAMKVPVKVVFPLVFCILPVLFIVVLTPAIAGVIGAFLR